MSVSEALKSSSEATVTQTGGTVNVAGRMDLGGTLNIQGGEFTVGKEGKVFVLQDAADAPAWGKNSAINMQGGVLNVDGYCPSPAAPPISSAMEASGIKPAWAAIARRGMSRQAHG